MDYSITTCPVCDTNLIQDYQYENNFHSHVICVCYVCGTFAFTEMNIDKNIFAPYLFYNNIILNNKDKYFFIGTSEQFAKVRKEDTRAVLLISQEVETWYPRTFSERIDKILLGLSGLSKYEGNYIMLPEDDIYSAFFAKRYKSDGSKIDIEEQGAQVEFIFKYLLESSLIDKKNTKYEVIILPEGLKRIDELQKNLSGNKDAFIAMSFAENMRNVKDAIGEAIVEAGYCPKIMNEIEHNNQIVPEILHQIRQCKFVVADFTNSNNGAYYEAGYAAGLGKEVIHVCREDIFNRCGHFDIKQKATILWKDVADLKEKLCKRIVATIPDNRT
jgi:nucleoside 2-deoxyribosyltransferase